MIKGRARWHIIIVLIGTFAVVTGSLFAVNEVFVTEPCPSDMVYVKSALTFTCVDRYEATTAPDCPIINPQSGEDTLHNLLSKHCDASTDGGIPWRFISRDEAKRICATSNKRLPTAAEWYQVALSSEISGCNLSREQINNTKNDSSGCASSDQVYDLIGNVWEWVDEDVIDRNYQGRILPESGYVTVVYQDGIAQETTTFVASSTNFYGHDYIWTAPGYRGMMRGGFYSSFDDGGLYATKADMPTTFRGEAVGFRCVK